MHRNLIQMRRIWKKTLTTEAGQHRLTTFSQPWLIENFIEEDGTQLRANFQSGRTAATLPRWERARRFLQSRQYLYDKALHVRTKALSYRDFNVGSSALAFRANHEHNNSWAVFSGMNVKHAPNMRPTCSEPITIGAAYAAHYDLIVGIVIVGELREEDVGKIKTLHPCHDCRWFMHGHPLVDDNTLVVTAMPPEKGGLSVRETRTVGQLLRLHRDISGDDFSETAQY